MDLLMILLVGYAMFWVGTIVLAVVAGACLEAWATIGQIGRWLRKRVRP
jgi:hypothetical protein